MNNLLVMNVDESLNHMIQIVLQFSLSNPLSTFHHLVESMVTTQL